MRGDCLRAPSSPSLTPRALRGALPEGEEGRGQLAPASSQPLVAASHSADGSGRSRTWPHAPHPWWFRGVAITLRVMRTRWPERELITRSVMTTLAGPLTRFASLPQLPLQLALDRRR